MSRSNLLNDIWCLHLPTLTWKQKPARVHSRPFSGVMRRAGHTLHGMLAFGGCVYEGHQLALVGGYDVLLLGAFHQGTAVYGSRTTRPSQDIDLSPGMMLVIMHLRSVPC